MDWFPNALFIYAFFYLSSVLELLPLVGGSEEEPSFFMANATDGWRSDHNAFVYLDNRLSYIVFQHFHLRHSMFLVLLTCL